MLGPTGAFSWRRLGVPLKSGGAMQCTHSGRVADMEERTTAGNAKGDAGHEGSESAGFSEARRGFLKRALTVGGMAASWGAAGLSSVSNAQAQPTIVPGTKNHYYLPATDKTVHWGYFSKLL